MGATGDQIYSAIGEIYVAGGYNLQIGPTQAYGRKDTSTDAEVRIR